MAYKERTEIKMELDGYVKHVAREDVREYLLDGWSFKNAQVHICRDDLKIMIYSQASTAKKLILFHGWRFGGRHTYELRGVKELRREGILTDKEPPRIMLTSLEIAADAWWLQK